MPAQDTKLVIRCPYCVLGLDFRPMAAYKDRRFVCEKCGRTVNPEEAAYLCSCCRCLRVKDVSAWLEERWLVVTDGCRRKAVHSFFPHQPYLHPPCRHAEWSIHGFSVQSDYNIIYCPSLCGTERRNDRRILFTSSLAPKRSMSQYMNTRTNVCP